MLPELGSAFLLAVAALHPLQTPRRPAHKVVTFNLFYESPERAARQRSALQVLRELDADVILLQEVWSGFLKPGDPAGTIARELGYSYRADWVLQDLFVFRHGLAILSRYPLDGIEGLKFSESHWLDHKGAVSARVSFPEGAVRVFDVHLSPETGTALKSSQFLELEEWVRRISRGSSAVIGGDFNEEDSSRAFRVFTATLGLENLYERLPPSQVHATFTPDYRRGCADRERGERLDYILLRNPGDGPQLRFESGGIVEPRTAPPPSDHCPVRASIRLSLSS